MSRLRVLIVDDELLARERLRGFLQAESAVEIIGECADGPAALAAIRQGTPDLVFLDMQMPGCDGLQVLAQLPEDRRPAIVFATAHERFAVDAFDVAAVDYLLKPFDRERFRQALARAQDHVQAHRPAGNPASPAAAPAVDRKNLRLAVKADGRIVFLKPEEIMWVEADDNYVTLHLATGRLMARETLASIENRLGHGSFTRISRSAIVQLDQIKELQPTVHGDYTVMLRDGTRLPLSRSLRGQLERFGVERK
ncbi:MAG TPA: LytTR family DNA-binding domain-containing protein [Lacunisphaera sp.]|nr:LytTR family DNA-binding domain-containing protein [Lacunisphaera sp.]